MIHKDFVTRITSLEREMIVEIKYLLDFYKKDEIRFPFNKRNNLNFTLTVNSDILSDVDIVLLFVTKGGDVILKDSVGEVFTLTDLSTGSLADLYDELYSICTEKETENENT